MSPDMDHFRRLLTPALGSHGPSRLFSQRSAAFLVAAVTVGVLAWPMLFTTSGFRGDWEHHLWYLWHQSLAIRADHAPSLFLNTEYSVFYPQYAFYGGTIYALGGSLAIVLGNSPLTAYILSYILCFAAAYGGWHWIARVVGLRGWSAHAPALLFVTSACYITLVYAEGDWPEFIAMSMIPLMVASGLSVVHAPRLRVLPALALVGSSAVFFGSHILTVLWASTLFALTFAAVAVCVPAARRQLRPRGLVRVAALLVPAVLVNGWFLAPLVAYASHTRIGSQYAVAYGDLRFTMRDVSFAHLFTFSRASTIGEVPDYALSLPTLPIIWVLVSSALVLGRVRVGAWPRMLALFALATAGIIVVMTHAGIILALPKPYTLLQFSYRLETYVAMGVTACVLALLVILRSSPGRERRWIWTLVPVLAFSALGAIQQVDAYPHSSLPRAAVFTPDSEVFASAFDDYDYVPLPLASERALPKLYIPAGLVHDNHAALTVSVRPGQAVATNIGGGPDLLHITGASIVGVDQRAQLVLALASPPSDASPNPHTAVTSDRISISEAQSAPVVLGRVSTLAGVLLLAVGLAALLARSWRERTRGAS
jgi:hypothetical protein